MPQRQELAEGRLASQAGSGGCGPRKADSRWGTHGRVNQAGQHSETANAVGERVMEDQHQARVAVGHASDKHRRPQGRGSLQRGHEHSERNVKQRALVAGLRTGDRADVVSDVELRIVDPDRATATERHPL